MSNELAVVEQQRAITPMELISQASRAGATIEQMQQLFELKKQMDAEEAKRAYVQAMADFKQEVIVITKDKENKQYGSRYSSLGNLVNTVTPFLAKYGLSAEWHMDQTAGIKVGCTITHALGHAGETKWMTVPQDTSGAKNPLQQIKSSKTYAKISTFEDACGLASSDGNLDDDGNGSSDSKPRMDEPELVNILENIHASKDQDELKRVYLLSVRKAQEIGDKAAEATIIKSKNARYKALASAKEGV